MNEGTAAASRIAITEMVTINSTSVKPYRKLRCRRMSFAVDLAYRFETQEERLLGQRTDERMGLADRPTAYT